MENKSVQFLSARILFFMVLTVTSVLAFGQSRSEKADIYSLPIPKNIQHCFSVLDKTMSDREITLIKILPEDSLYSNKEFKEGVNFFHAWKLYKESQLTRYFQKKGLKGSYEMYETILT